MRREQFQELIERLETVFEPLDTKKFVIYYEHLGRIEPGYLRRGIDWLIENHPYKRFPLIAEINDAVKTIAAGLSSPDAADVDSGRVCPKCNSMGWEIVEKYEPLYQGMHEFARYCTCSVGQAMKKAQLLPQIKKIAKTVVQGFLTEPEFGATETLDERTTEKAMPRTDSEQKSNLGLPRPQGEDNVEESEYV